MRIEICNEVLSVPNGTYSAEIIEVFEYTEERICMKLKIGKEVLVKFFKGTELSSYPWSGVFRALDSTDTDDLMGRNVEITVANNTSKKTGKEFCNIKKVKLL